MKKVKWRKLVEVFHEWQTRVGNQVDIERLKGNRGGLGIDFVGFSNDGFEYLMVFLFVASDMFQQ